MREAIATVTRLDNGWVQAKVPLPFSLRWVNAYLLPNGKRWTIIDPGLRSEETEAFWTETMGELRIEWPDIEAIVLTHYHPDHYGLGGWFQERTGAPVHMSEVAAAYARRLWGEDETFSEELIEAFLSHGFPDELLGGMRDHLSGVKKQVLPHPAEIRLLPEPGERFEMAGLTWELIGGEGHAPGHRAFYQPESRILLCGDQVLPHITPNIGWLPGGDPDPLGSYLASLERMLSYEVTVALPGHRDPFPDFRGRVEELIAHHARRLKQIEGLLEEAGAMSSYELCDKLFGARISGNSHNHRFAMSETIAHVERLVFSGAAVRIGADGTEMEAVTRAGSLTGRQAGMQGETKTGLQTGLQIETQVGLHTGMQKETRAGSQAGMQGETLTGLQAGLQIETQAGLRVGMQACSSQAQAISPLSAVKSPLVPPPLSSIGFQTPPPRMPAERQLIRYRRA